MLFEWSKATDAVLVLVRESGSLESLHANFWSQHQLSLEMPPLVSYGSSDEEDNEDVPQVRVRPEYRAMEKIKVATDYQVLT